MPVVPYERQVGGALGRRCGAACLCMVYRAFGIEQTQDDVWPYIARGDGRGRRCARTYLLASHALRRGLTALVTQARDPGAVLEACTSNPVCVILNHRCGPDSADGHYSVLVATDAERVILHDPERGPALFVGRQDLLALWQRRGDTGEVSGPILVAFAPLTPDPSPPGGQGRIRGGMLPVAACSHCQTPIPEQCACRRCGNAIPLRPAVVLGCVAAGCPARLWEKVFCPYCDTAVTDLAP